MSSPGRGTHLCADYWASVRQSRSSSDTNVRFQEEPDSDARSDHWYVFIFSLYVGTNYRSLFFAQMTLLSSRV